PGPGPAPGTATRPRPRWKAAWRRCGRAAARRYPCPNGPTSTRRSSEASEVPAMKIALDPYMLRRVPLTDLPGLVADLGYSCIDLSPREDFLPFFLHPRADRAQIAAFKRALS